MKQAEENLRRAAINYLEAAQEVQESASAETAPSDPLDEVNVELFNLGTEAPAVSKDELAELHARLDNHRLPAQALLSLIDIARMLKESLLF